MRLPIPTMLRSTRSMAGFSVSSATRILLKTPFCFFPSFGAVSTFSSSLSHLCRFPTFKTTIITTSPIETTTLTRKGKDYDKHIRIPPLPPFVFIIVSENTTHSKRRRRRSIVTQIRNMSSDASATKMDTDYETFLKKSQKDYSAEYSVESNVKATAVKAEPHPHPAIKNLGERYYISEADEPFKSITFQWKKESLPTVDEFDDLVGVNTGDVEILQPNEWDPRGQYQDIINAVKEACNGGNVQIYRVSVGDSDCRFKYFIVGLEERAEKVVGVKTFAVES